MNAVHTFSISSVSEGKQRFRRPASLERLRAHQGAPRRAHPRRAGRLGPSRPSRKGASPAQPFGTTGDPRGKAPRAGASGRGRRGGEDQGQGLAPSRRRRSALAPRLRGGSYARALGRSSDSWSAPRPPEGVTRGWTRCRSHRPVNELQKGVEPRH